MEAATEASIIAHELRDGAPLGSNAIAGGSDAALGVSDADNLPGVTRRRQASGASSPGSDLGDLIVQLGVVGDRGGAETPAGDPGKALTSQHCKDGGQSWLSWFSSASSEGFLNFLITIIDWNII